MQNYNVHTYVISMEFSAVNRRRPSRETPLGPGAKKDGCFRRLDRNTVHVFSFLENIHKNIFSLKSAEKQEYSGCARRVIFLFQARKVKRIRGHPSGILARCSSELSLLVFERMCGN